MKLFFASDIHGSSYYLNKTIEKFKEEQADTIIILGDLLYHGPRNPLPKEYDPQEVAQCLNEYCEHIIAVRGNCDSEVDQMVINFPIMSDYAMIFYNDRRIFATHGHKFNAEHLPNLSKGDILIQGHTHIPVADMVSDIYILNPGSVSLPKENNPSSYGIMEDDKFEVKDFDGNVIRSVEFAKKID